MDCDALKTELSQEYIKLDTLQSQLKHAPWSTHASIISQIQTLQGQISFTQADLKQCQQQSDASPLSASFNCTYSISTTFGDPKTRGPFTGAESLVLWFDTSRTEVFVIGFVPILITPFLIGSTATDTLTVTLNCVGTGSFDKATGQVVTPIELQFHQSADFAPFTGDDSNLSLTLSGVIGGTVPNVNADSLTLVGSGVFSGGALAGNTATLTLTGTLASNP